MLSRVLDKETALRIQGLMFHFRTIKLQNQANKASLHFKSACSKQGQWLVWEALKADALIELNCQMGGGKKERKKARKKRACNVNALIRSSGASHICISVLQVEDWGGGVGVGSVHFVPALHFIFLLLSS